MSLSTKSRPSIFRHSTSSKSVALAMALAFVTTVSRAADAQSTVTTIDYHGWSNVVSVNNGVVEAIVVPAIGRLQQFRFVGQTNGALWEDPATFGQVAGGRGQYKFFGGDRAWPSPQAVWNWPPPRGFDGSTNTVSFADGVVTLVTPVDQSFGIRSTRYIELLPGKPVMRIRTVFERVATASRTNSLGIWIDCMAAFAEGSRCYVPVPSPSIFQDGYTTKGSAQYTAELPHQFKNENGVISFGSTRDADREHHKLGFDGGTLVLVGKDLSFRVDAPRVAGAEYPDGNSSTEVYTSTADYELEMMGPLRDLPQGEKMEYTVTYSLFHRTEATTDADAKKVLEWKP